LVTLNFRDPAGQSIVFCRQANQIMSNIAYFTSVVLRIGKRILFAAKACPNIFANVCTLIGFNLTVQITAI
jgi:hypothetical protein